MGWAVHLLGVLMCHSDAVSVSLYTRGFTDTLPGANLELFGYRWGQAGVAWPAELALSSYGG